MAASGLAERRATLARLKTINAGRAWQGSIDDEAQIPRMADGKIYPHAVIDFGAPIRSMRERNLTNGDLKQPHLLYSNIACVAGTAEQAQQLLDAIIELLVDWAPSDTSDPWHLEGGFGDRRAATGNIPTRHISGIFLETTVNLGVD